MGSGALVDITDCMNFESCSNSKTPVCKSHAVTQLLARLPLSTVVAMASVVVVVVVVVVLVTATAAADASVGRKRMMWLK